MPPKPPFAGSGGPRYGNYPRRNNDPYSNIRRNQRIRAPQVRLIGPDGKQVGVVPTEQALKLAQQHGLDLVEVAATANPPVCRILDFGKYMYEESKKTKSSKTSSSKIKEIELTPRIDPHDLGIKLRHGEEFLYHGNKVKLRLKFRGREMAHTDVGFEIVKKAIEELSHIGHPDSEAKLAGRSIIVMVSPLPANKRKLKFNAEKEAPPPPPASARPAAEAPAAPAASSAPAVPTTAQ
jgi:translation initiation factor IF-3